MDLGIQGKVAVVVAASTGLGRASALELARAGCALAICARNPVGIQATARSIADETGARVLPVVADMTQAADIEGFVASAREQLGFR